MPSFRARVLHHTRQQVVFAREYAPLYARLFRTLAGWLARPAGQVPTEAQAVVAWLLATGRERDAFSVPVLLLAGLHREVLAANPAVAGLAPYYPTVSDRPRDPGVEADATWEPRVWGAILACRERLTPFVRSATVQTNETSRGLAWLLPALVARWTAVHLVDLGASAGLNLMADARHYRLTGPDDATIVSLGAAPGRQFELQARGELAAVGQLGTRPVPGVLSRIGGDLHPFHLRHEDDALTLQAFVWADQPERLLRLREGLSALAAAANTPAPVRLHPLRLPGELPAFLRDRVPRDRAPVLLYNTYITRYLPDRGRRMAGHIAAWARAQDRPVLWCQLEPDKAAPQFGWCAWRLDLWRAGQHQQWQLGWAHPHLTQIHFEPDLANWIAVWP